MLLNSAFSMFFSSTLLEVGVALAILHPRLLRPCMSLSLLSRSLNCSY
jgi:hypothetical protein